MSNNVTNSDVPIDDDMFQEFEQLVSQLTLMKSQISLIQQNIKQWKSLEVSLIKPKRW